MSLDAGIRNIRGVGPKKAELLNGLGIRTLGDALRHFPRGYTDRSAVTELAVAAHESHVTIRCVVESVRSAPTYGGASKAPMRVTVSDGSSRAEVVFFNARFLRNAFTVGETYYFHGAIRKEGRLPTLMHPEFCRESEWQTFSSLTPVYPLTAGLTQTDLRNLTAAVVKLIPPQTETLPEAVVDALGLPDAASAYRGIHQPASLIEAESARRRFAFEELYLMQLALLLIKRDTYRAVKKHVYGSRALLGPLFDNLPFSLTGGQETVLEEILTDMASTGLMNRLVQGDVGSGKTVLALAAVAYAALSGHQAAVMAPTELLARQHHRFFSQLLDPLGIRTVLLVSGLKERARILAEVADGAAAVVIGTHALIQETVAFKDLSLVVTDEQHRFGVRQRSQLARKSQDHPDILYMSATPIPRTLSLILYGDVEVSYLKEMPKGREPIKTRHIKEARRADMYRFVEEELDAGRQAYVVCPLVADSEEVDALSAEAHYDALRTGPFKERRVGLIHGRMKQQDKDQAMQRFLAGDTDILVSTTVIEVGVDVPRATVMIIEDSDRFGLAQLHQLRGRVGRGGGQSWCFLMCREPGKVARERIKTLTESTDGFYIAQKDLELRGPGEILGTRQHGLPELKAANLLTDQDLLELARDAALETSRKSRMPEAEEAFINRFMADVSL